MSRSIPAHSQYLSSLFNCCWMDVALLDITAMSFAWTAEFNFVLEVLKVYPWILRCSHLSNGSRKMMKR